MSSNTALTWLSCGYNQLTASALNDLFRSLPDAPFSKLKNIEYPLFYLVIGWNPGISDCDVSIAQAKGWTVSPPYDHPRPLN